MAYAKRRIDVIVQLGKGDFGEGGFNEVTLKGLRVSAEIIKSGVPEQNEGHIRIYGMMPDLMNKLSSLGRQSEYYQRFNQVTIMAGDEGGAMSRVYMGIIVKGWTVYDGMPEVFFGIYAQTAMISAVKPVPASSYPGSADAVVIMQTLAKTMGKSFENNGVPTTMLANPYFPGTALMQTESCARAANIGWMIDDTTLAIWPMFGMRKGDAAEISPKTGMVLYPGYTDTGVRITTEYNPGIKFGGQIKVESDVQPANGLWVVNKLSHTLESETPNGAWFTTLEGYRLGSSPTLPK